MNNLTNQRFGTRVVTGDSGSRNGGAVLWNWLCDCGNTGKETADQLRKSKNCKECSNLTNQRFGTRVVTGDSGKRTSNGTVLWNWLCDCGNTGEATAGQLRKHQYCSNCRKPDDLTGQRFGRWVVIKRVPNKGRSVYYQCQCDCGTVRDVRREKLQGGSSTSCGCFQKEFASERQKNNVKPILIQKDSNNCWNCVSHGLDKDGYPMITRNSKKQRMSHYIYKKYKGPIPAGCIVRHTCDNPQCINLDHLLTGTQQDNIDDKVGKGRQAKGEQIWNAKLTESDVRAIRADKTSTVVEQAKKYGVGTKAINKARNHLTWKHIV